MEDECHQLDLELAQLTVGERDDREGYSNYSKKIHKISSLEEEREKKLKYAHSLESACMTIALQLGDGAQTSPLINNLLQEAKRARDSAEVMVRLSLYNNMYINNL